MASNWLSKMRMGVQLNFRTKRKKVPHAAEGAGLVSLSLLFSFCASRYADGTRSRVTQDEPAQHLLLRTFWANDVIEKTRRVLNGHCRNLTSCDDGPIVVTDMEGELPSGYTEADRFYQCLEYHRSLLPDYLRRWGDVSNEAASTSQTTWPSYVPRPDEINSLEVDLAFCLRSPTEDRTRFATCQDTQFRIATFYLKQNNDPDQMIKGYKLTKDLAEKGHPDGMCLYGIILNEGEIEGVDANPEEAVVWWRRCVDCHRHITATYELGVALYTGEGVPENPGVAVRLFRRAAHLGHSGAAYMLGECLLDGVGAPRDRADALEWLVTAAELGHPRARQRVIFVLHQDYDRLDAGEARAQPEHEEVPKWVNDDHEERVRAMNIERRFTVGGGSRNPEISARRKSKVAESRE